MNSIVPYTQSDLEDTNTRGVPAYDRPNLYDTVGYRNGECQAHYTTWSCATDAGRLLIFSVGSLVSGRSFFVIALGQVA